MAVERFLPTTLGQAMELCRKHRDEAKIIGGGTDLVIRIKKGVIQPRVLISLEKVRELRFISYEKDSGLVMGSMTTAADLEKSELVREKAEVLCTAAGTLGNPLIRRSATIGGNLCNAAPSADLAPVCLVLGARLKVMGLEGEREIGIDDFFKGPGQTALAPGELLTRIIFPPLPPKAKAVYLKASRSRGADLALVGVAVMTEIEGIRIKDIKIALGAGGSHTGQGDRNGSGPHRPGIDGRTAGRYMRSGRIGSLLHQRYTLFR